MTCDTCTHFLEYAGACAHGHAVKARPSSPGLEPWFLWERVAPDRAWWRRLRDGRGRCSEWARPLRAEASGRLAG